MIFTEPYSKKGYFNFDGGERYKPRMLIEQISPVLPMMFDRSLLPTDICQMQYLKLVQCENALMISNEKNPCQYATKLFYDCKIKRDAIIFGRIKEWQTEHFSGLDFKNRQMYLQGLTNKLTRIQDTIESIPSIPSTETKLKVMSGEVDQIKWRMRYLNKLLA